MPASTPASRGSNGSSASSASSGAATSTPVSPEVALFRGQEHPNREWEALATVPVKFDRELVEPDEPDASAAACGFQVGTSFTYPGMLHVKGRPFASLSVFGSVRSGSFVAEEGRLDAGGSFYTDLAHVSGDVNLPEVSLYAAAPIVRGDFLHVTRTRIATRTSVKGAFFSPDVKLPSNVRLKTPLREDAFRIPCHFVTPNQPDTPVTRFPEAGMVWLDAPDKIVGLSTTPEGPPVAEIVHPAGMVVSLLGMYKTTALVAVEATSETSDVTLVGWIHEGNLDDGSGTIGHGYGTGHGGRERQHVTCNGVPILVSVEGRLLRVAEVQDRMTLYGARSPSGDFRVDLGANPAWSATAPSKNGPTEPLDPFIPAEYLVRCKSSP